MQDPSHISVDIVPVLVQLARQLGSYAGYLRQRNDIHSLDQPRAYFLSRCIDSFLTASMAFIRWERCRTIQVRENDDLCSRSPIARDVAVDSEVTVLASIIRPSVEMYVELMSLEMAQAAPISADELCRIILYNHLAGDCEQKREACMESYGCSPSYFAAGAVWYRKAIEQVRPLLSSAGANILSTQRKKFAKAFASASSMDKVALGGDSFSSQAVLAYKLHFLPQKNVPHTPQGLHFFRVWCGMLLSLLGAKIIKATGEQVQGVDCSMVEATDTKGPTDATNPNCPHQGDVVFFDWGVGQVEKVDPRPLGNEILFINYDVAFVPELQSPDQIPRRFLKCILNRHQYEEALKEQMDRHGVNLPGDLAAAGSAGGTLLEIYMAFYNCRVDKGAGAAEQGIAADGASPRS